MGGQIELPPIACLAGPAQFFLQALGQNRQAGAQGVRGGGGKRRGFQSSGTALKGLHPVTGSGAPTGWKLNWCGGWGQQLEAAGHQAQLALLVLAQVVLSDYPQDRLVTPNQEAWGREPCNHRQGGGHGLGGLSYGVRERYGSGRQTPLGEVVGEPGFYAGFALWVGFYCREPENGIAEVLAYLRVGQLGLFGLPENSFVQGCSGGCGGCRCNIAKVVAPGGLGAHHVALKPPEETANIRGLLRPHQIDGLVHQPQRDLALHRTPVHIGHFQAVGSGLTRLVGGFVGGYRHVQEFFERRQQKTRHVGIIFAAPQHRDRQVAVGGHLGSKFEVVGEGGALEAHNFWPGNGLAFQIDQRPTIGYWRLHHEPGRLANLVFGLVYGNLQALVVPEPVRTIRDPDPVFGAGSPPGPIAGLYDQGIGALLG